ncbi:cell wall protein [Nonomuraea aurantiaca]|uniref:cell wall protein n=1 Tax=Nonomuraea aurantiaca TaxID=2878562 RepID=UPI001CD995AD|nr:cell wall protein [Nonomuraea aurantiaca]MCA2229562.1 cell wall protein [Nonomuraea aurantiaca]
MTSRRQMLKSALLGGGASVVAATALGSLGPEAAFATAGAPEVEPGTVDPNFAEGRIRSIKDNTLLVLGSNMVFHNIRVVDGTSLWKLGPVPFEQAKPGDGLYARGVRMPDGVLAAEAVWLNIVNIKGHIKNITSDKIHLDHNGQEVLCHVVPGKSVAVHSESPPSADLSMLRVSQHVQILGAWRPDTNEVDIATVFSPH